MAKKVVISDLVVKVGIESKATERKLKDLDKEITKSTKKQTREAEKRAKAEAKAVMNAKAWMNTSREFYKLRKIDGKTAKRIQDQLTKSYVSGDRARQGALKSQISQRLDAYREEAAQETRKERNYKKSMRARMLMRKRAYKDTARQNKLQEIERKREERFRKEQHRAMRTRVRRTAMGVGESFGHVGKYALGAAGLSVAGAGFGAVEAGKDAVAKTSDLRGSENTLRIGLESRGQGADFQKVRNQTVLDAAKLDSDPASIIREMSELLVALPKQTVKSIHDLTLGISSWGNAFNLSETQKANSMLGLKQVAAGGLTAQNFKQITENMPVIENVVAKALGLSREQYISQLHSGNIGDAVKKVGGVDKFVDILANALYRTGVKHFKSTIGSLPETQRRAGVVAGHLATSFGTGAEHGITSFLEELIKVMGEYQGDFRQGGEYVGDFIQATGQVLRDDIIPMIAGFSGSLKDMPSKDRIAMFKEGIEDFGSGLKLLAEAFVVVKALGIITTIAELTTAIGTLSAAGAGVGIALAPVIAFLAGIASMATVATSSRFKKGGDESAGGIFGENAFTNLLDTPISQLFSSTPSMGNANNMVNGIPVSGANSTVDNSKHMYVQGNIDHNLYETLLPQFSVENSPYPTRD